MSKSNRVAVLGGGGLLGSHIYAVMKEANFNVATQTSERFCKPDELNAYLRNTSPDSIINCIGYLGRDEAKHLFVNGCLPRLIGDWAVRHKALFIHISTNAVFQSDCERAWSPDDTPCPSTAYELSKAIGEDPRAYVIRTSFIGRARNGKGIFERILTNRTYQDRLWNGVTALVVGERIREIVQNHSGESLSHVEHVHSPNPIRMSQLAAHVGRATQPAEFKSDARLLAGDKRTRPFWEQLREYHRWLTAGNIPGVQGW